MHLFSQHRKSTTTSYSDVESQHGWRRRKQTVMRPISPRSFTWPVHLHISPPTSV